MNGFKHQGEMEVTPACYAHFTSALMGLANGRIAVVLEVRLIQLMIYRYLNNISLFAF